MGTTYTIKVVGEPSKIDAQAIRRELAATLADIDAQMSVYRSDSAISRFNASESTGWFAVPAGLARLVAASQAVSERSEGAFDITVGPLVDAWGFGAAGEPPTLPTPQAVAELRARTGFALLEVRQEPPALRKRHPGLKIDVNGVAPGYALDVLAERFEALGLRSFMIEIGGEVLVRGLNANGDPWRIAVEQPFGDAPQRPFKILALRDASVTTSGEYRHYFERDGQRYSHTLDPRTGRPIVRSGSVCVVGSSSLLADAWATALNVLGPEDGLALAEREGLAVMYVQADEGRLKARMSSAFAREVEVLEVSEPASRSGASNAIAEARGS